LIYDVVYVTSPTPVVSRSRRRCSSIAGQYQVSLYQQHSSDFGANSFVPYSEEQEQQRVAVGPGNVHFISIRRVSSDASMLQRGSCWHCCMPRRCCCSAAADTALGNLLIKIDYYSLT